MAKAKKAASALSHLFHHDKPEEQAVESEKNPEVEADASSQDKHQPRHGEVDPVADYQNHPKFAKFQKGI